MKVVSKITIVILLALTVVVLVVNVRCLYTFPAPNSWIYWAGDETQSMAETQSQMTTGLYTYPNAVGSIFQNGSGIIKGSTWITSAVYGAPARLTNANPVDVGRSISFILGSLLLVAVYLALRRSHVLPVIALAVILLLASTTAFLIMSHSARPDMLIGLMDLLLIAAFIRYPKIEHSGSLSEGIGVGLLIFGGLLVSAHVWIDCALPVTFLLWRRGILSHWKVMSIAVATVMIGFVFLSFLFVIRTGRFDLWGPFDHVPIPLYRFFSPGAQRGNLLYRFFIVREWSPFYIIATIPLALGLVVTRLRGSRLDPTLISWFGATALLAFSIVYFEAILPRYYIYLLPVLTVSIGLVTQRIWDTLSKPAYRWAFAIADLLIVTAGAASFTLMTRSTESFADTIAKSNREAIFGALNAIEHDPSSSKRVIVSTPALYGLANSHTLEAIVPLFLTAPAETVRTGDHSKWPVADYIVTFNSTRVVDVIDNDRTYSAAFSKHWRKLFERTGVLTDIGRSYSDDGMWGDDTLRLYRIIH